MSRPAFDLVILCYHAVSSAWPSEGAIEPAVLERQLRHLIGRGYVPRTLGAALAEPERRSLVVTFDDAFASVLERALPIMRRLDAPATVFVPTDFAERGDAMTWSTLAKWAATEHESELRCMTWEELRRLVDLGWEVGSHTCSHPNLTSLGQEALAAELVASKRACEEALQLPCDSLAYPFGAEDETVVRAARSAGYGAAVTLGTRLLGPRERRDPLRVSREGIYRETSWRQFLIATSPTVGRLRESSLFRALTPF